jgi:hypothetical protein
MSPLLIIYLLGALIVFILCTIMYRTDTYKEIFFFDSTTDSADAFDRTIACTVFYPFILAFYLLEILAFLLTLVSNEIGHIIFKMPKKEM